MTTSHSPSTTATRAAVRSPRRRCPGPFPVIVTRPATTTATPLSVVQRDRRHTADRGGAELTAAARQGRLPCIEYRSRALISDVPQASRIIATAAALATDPGPGALRVGRDLCGRPVAVVLHAERWSLLIRSARVGHAPTSWAFIDRDHGDLDAADGYLPFSGFIFDDEPSVAGVEWTRMLVAVLNCAA